jgi:hypothetical protein
MGAAGIGAALRRGAPLVDVVIRLRPGVDYAEATARLNSLADDFDLDPGHYYGDPSLRIGVATKEALERLFGWRLIRVPLARYRGDRHLGGLGRRVPLGGDLPTTALSRRSIGFEPEHPHDSTRSERRRPVV